MRLVAVVGALVTISIVLQLTIIYRQQSTNAPQAGQRPGVQEPSEATVIELAGLPQRGDPKAPIALIEFSDYECPFCARHATGVLGELSKRFVDTKQVVYAFANNPLPNHQHAKWLASLAICAGQQGVYWEMHDRLFSNRPERTATHTAVVGDLKVDERQFAQCMDDGSYPSSVIGRDKAIVDRLGLRSTPVFAVGRVDTNGDVHIAKYINGAQPMAVFDKVITELASDTDSWANWLAGLFP